MASPTLQFPALLTALRTLERVYGNLSLGIFHVKFPALQASWKEAKANGTPFKIMYHMGDFTLVAQHQLRDGHPLTPLSTQCKLVLPSLQISIQASTDVAHTHLALAAQVATLTMQEMQSGSLTVSKLEEAGCEIAEFFSNLDLVLSDEMFANFSEDYDDDIPLPSRKAS